MTELIQKERIRIPCKPLLAFLEEVLCRLGVEISSARTTAEALWTTSLRGIDSHGVRLLPHYVEGLRGGRINPNASMRFSKTGLCGGHLDADHGFAHVAGVSAMEHAIAMAESAGAGFVSVRNSNHCAALAFYAERACKHDMVGLAFTHATPKVRTPGSNRPFFGINPMCVAAPMAEEEPFCFDSAPTTFPNNKVKQYAEDGLPLPHGVGADRNGFETTNASIVEMLLPIGGYKGFGLAVVADIFSGFLSGMPVGPDVSAMYGNSLSEKRYLGQFYGAIRIDLFEDPQRFKTRLRETAIRLRSEPAVGDGPPPMLPGDPEKLAYAERITNGIPVTKGDFHKFKMLADTLNISTTIFS